MKIRRPSASQFYQGNLEKQIETFLEDYNPPKNRRIIAGIVPHAGWMFSGRVAAKVFAAIKNFKVPETIIFFGTVHNMLRVRQHSVFSHGAWQTSLGTVEIDESIAQSLLQSGKDLLIDDADAHSGEHSIEVQLPFVKYLMPDTKIVPVAVLPSKDAHIIGRITAEVVKNVDSDVVVVGSTDLTHYGEGYGFAPAGYGNSAKQWMEQNDMMIINKAINLECEELVMMAREKHNACGSGAMAAATAFAKEMKASEGILLEYITSFDIMPDPVFTMAVGYAGIIFN